MTDGGEGIDGRNRAQYLGLLKQCLTASLYDESAWQIIGDERIRKPEKWNVATALKDVFRKLLIRQLQRRSLLLIRRKPYNAARREAGEEWPCFGFTMVGKRRLDNLEQCMADVIAKDVPGDFIETGAWRGGATIFMRAVLMAYGIKNRLIYVADSFDGLPRPKDEADGWDLSHVKFLKVSLEEVKANFARFGLLDDQVRFLPGWFKDTLPTAPIRKLAILRLDGDLYSSTMDALTNLYKKVSPGGYVIIDDYYSWPSCKQAIEDYLRQERIRVQIQGIDTGAAYWKVIE